MVSILRITGVLLILAVNTAITAQQDGEVITTHSGSVVNITIPHNETGTSSIYFWTHYPNTNVSLRFTSHMNYVAKFTITQPDMWHIGYLSQPTEKRAVGISIPHGKIYTNLDYTRVRQVAVTSGSLVYWAFCKNRHLCALVIPDSRLLSGRSADNDTSARTNMTKITMDITATTSSRPQYLLVSLLVLCFLLVVAVVVLSVFLCCRRRSKLFHVYEKPCHPPLPPPMLPRIVIRSKNGRRDTQDTSINDSDDGDDEAPYATPYNELQHPSNLRWQRQHDRRLQESDTQRPHQKNRQRGRQLHHPDKTQLIDASGRHLYQYDNNQLIDTSNRYLYERNNNQTIGVKDRHLSQNDNTNLIDTSNHHFSQHNAQLIDTSNRHVSQNDNTQLIDTSNRPLSQHDTQLIDTTNRPLYQHDNTQQIDTGDHDSLNSIYGIIIR